MNTFNKLSRQELRQLSDKELKAQGQPLGIKVYGTKNEMIDKILAGYEKLEKFSKQTEQFVIQKSCN